MRTSTSTSASFAVRIRIGISRGSREFVDAGFDHVHVHQVDEDRSTFFRFYEREMLARVARL
jgi:hypothetical protein